MSAPTGSGKTLAAFLRSIDELWQLHQRGGVPDETLVVYVSPLKALAADISENLTAPLKEIAEAGRSLGFEPPDLRVAVRSGDTAPSERAAMLRRAPHFLITTPESLYLLLTAERSREMLRSPRWVIVDEIHAVARDKRGSHLSLSLERLAHVCRTRPKRIGLSATQRPLSTLARLLVGSTEGGGDCSVVDVGHRRKLDLALELPPSELEAVAPAEQMAEILDSITELIQAHRTTLVFVNTRREAERTAHMLGERLGEGEVAAHHGSLSKDRRLRVESLLRAGELRALVATASLELGIDIGPVDLVCQIGSPRSMNVFLQRVGRSGHSVGAVPKGRIFPTTRDQLVECAALLAGVRAGRLDAVAPPVAPLDILIQQITAECAAERWQVDALYELVRRAAPYADLSRAVFDEALEFVNSGVLSGNGRRGAYVHLDAEAGEAHGRRGARLAALTSGGAIGDAADYRVLLDPDDTLIGTVNEDWAIESMAGDIFLLGSHSWRIRRIESGVVRVVDAAGAPPTLPFWLGEAPARTAELSREVSDLRAEVLRRLSESAEAAHEGTTGANGTGSGTDGANDTSTAPDGAEAARAAVAESCGVSPEAAEAVVDYLAASRAILGTLPTQERLVVERFFDDTGGMQLIVHSPWGGRLNRGLGLALRKRFCRTFDFELQAAANDDAVALSLGPQHSFPLESVMRMLAPETVEDTLTQAILPTPMFSVRWRWNLNRALVVLRFKRGRRNPPPIQRMEADDMMASVFPALAACGENLAGPIPIPDHLLVRQTVADALTEAADVDGLKALLEDLRSGKVQVEVRDTPEPSPLSHEILNGRPFTFLDDAPLEERRSRAVRTPRGLPVDLTQIGSLSPDAVERVRAEAAPDVRDPDELHDLLSSLVICRPQAEWQEYFDRLQNAGRADLVRDHWCTAANRSGVRRLLTGADPKGKSEVKVKIEVEGRDADGDADLIREAVRGRLEITGPVTATGLAASTSLAESQIRSALGALEAEGFAISGRFEVQGEEGDDRQQAGGGETSSGRLKNKIDGTQTDSAGAQSEADLPDLQWCSRRLLTRIHVYSLKRRRAGVQPSSAADFMRFLLRWQHATPETRVRGRAGLRAVASQLQGYETAAGAWEKHVLTSRISAYRPLWLDELCLSGELLWGRLSIRSNDDTQRGAAASRSTPITLAMRADAGWLMAAARGEGTPSLPETGAAAEILEALERRGARFGSELATDCRRLPADIAAGLTEGVARGLLTADGFGALRSLFGARARARRSTHLGGRRGAGLRRGSSSATGPVGRWSLLTLPEDDYEPDALAEAVAEQLLARWGVVFRDLMRVESLTLPWRDILWALRRLEARGLVRGGLFVSGFSGEQYALPAAADDLRRVRGLKRSGERVSVYATDPLNLTGILTPGPRVPAAGVARITFVDGVPEASADAAAQFGGAEGFREEQKRGGAVEGEDVIEAELAAR